MRRVINSSVVFTLVIIIGFTIIQMLSGESNSMQLDFEDDHITIVGPEKFTLNINYEEIESIELVEHPQLGDTLSGGEKRNVIYGRHKNPLWGEYDVCLTKNSEKCIVIHTENGITIFSYESTETTEQLSDVLPQLLANKGYVLSDKIMLR